jgi:hypothetical protein
MKSSIEKSILSFDLQHPWEESNPGAIEKDGDGSTEVQDRRLDVAKTLIKVYLLGNRFESERKRIEESPPSSNSEEHQCFVDVSREVVELTEGHAMENLVAYRTEWILNKGWAMQRR